MQIVRRRDRRRHIPAAFKVNIRRLNDIAVTQNQRPLDHVIQLPHIARPMIGEQRALRPVAQ